MADLSVADTVMPLARLKSLLSLTKEEATRVPCVVGLDLAAEGVMMMARTGSPKKLRKDLLATIKSKSLGSKIKTDNQNILFGYASTDPGLDRTLRLTLNREPVGAQKLAAKLLRRVKSAGFDEVVFGIDAQLDGESEAEADGETDLAALYGQRMAGLTPDLVRALKEQIGDVSKIRAVTEFAREKAAGGAYEPALKALDALEQLLHAAPVVPEGADNYSSARFAQLHDAWAESKQAVNRTLSELHAEIIDEFDDPESATAANNLARILARFNEGLGTTLDAIRGADDAGVRGQLAAKAGRIAGMYLAYLELDPLIAHVEANPYEIEVAIKATLAGPLTAVQEEVAKFATV